MRYTEAGKDNKYIRKNQFLAEQNTKLQVFSAYWKDKFFYYQMKMLMIIITATTIMQTEMFNKYFYFTFGKMQDNAQVDKCERLHKNS